MERGVDKQSGAERPFQMVGVTNAVTTYFSVDTTDTQIGFNRY